MSDGFIERVYEIARQIPPGKVLSYGTLALMAGKPRAARMVGRAMSHCPDGNGVPCHRVIRADGSLCDGYAFGIFGLQRELLRSEGVSFLKDGRVNLPASRWKGQPL